jgi:hypothetical protein
MSWFQGTRMVQKVKKKTTKTFLLHRLLCKKKRKKKTRGKFLCWLRQEKGMEENSGYYRLLIKHKALHLL